MKKILTILIAAAALFGMTSCTSEVTLTAQKDGFVLVSFEGKCGEYFKSMLKSVSDAENGPLFDVSGIKQSFYTDGFKNVAVSAPDNVSLKTSFIAPKNTFLFTSGLVLDSSNQTSVRVNRDILKKFYKSADEDIVSVLDLLLAPVFNDEEMNEEEYLETLGAFYGEDASTEIGEAEIHLTLISEDGKNKKDFTVPLSKILTLPETSVLFYSSK